MKPLKLIMLLTASTLLASCAGGAKIKPTATALSDKPFVLEVPKGLTGEESLLKGVKIKDYKKFKRGEGVRDFFSVKIIEHPKVSELTTEICRGEYFPSARSYNKSCVFYDAKVSITENTASYTIAIAPYKLRSEQGRNALFFPIDLPKAGINQWYNWVARQSIHFSYEATSKYPSESIKGNFDRSFQKYTSLGQKDAALKQFKDSYILPRVGDTHVSVGASFYPYREGSLVKSEFVAEDFDRNGKTVVDWVSVVNKAKSMVDGVVSK